MGERVRVDTGFSLGERVRAGLGGDHRRVAEERRRFGRAGELAGELAEVQMLRALFDEAERRDVPERGRATVAEDDLVPVGEFEEVGEAGPDLADDLLDARTPVRGAEVARAGRGEGSHRFGADLGRAGTEPAVAGFEVGRNLDLLGRVGHGKAPLKSERVGSATLPLPIVAGPRRPPPRAGVAAPFPRDHARSR